MPTHRDCVRASSLRKTVNGEISNKYFSWVTRVEYAVPRKHSLNAGIHSFVSRPQRASCTTRTAENVLSHHVAWLITSNNWINMARFAGLVCRSKENAQSQRHSVLKLRVGECVPSSWGWQEESTATLPTLRELPCEPNILKSVWRAKMEKLHRQCNFQAASLERNKETCFSRTRKKWVPKTWKEGPYRHAQEAGMTAPRGGVGHQTINKRLKQTDLKLVNFM